MALTVASGTLLDDAFASVEDCTEFCTAHGLTDWTGAERSPPEGDEAAIRRATAWLSSAFTWKGYRTNGRDQSLAWPRAGVEDAEGEAVASDEIPPEVAQACCIAAAYERANPGGLTPNVVLQNRVKAKGVGPLRKEFFAAPMTPEAAKPVLTRVNGLIGGLLGEGGNPLVGRLVRG